MTGDILPHGKVNRPFEAVPKEDTGTRGSDPLVMFSHPGFRRSQGRRCCQHKPTGRRLRLSSKTIVWHRAIRNRQPGLVVIEITQLPNKPPQTLGALRALPTLEAA